MSMLALSAGLRGPALLIQRVKDIIYGDSITIRVEVDPEFEASSLIIAVHILSDAIRAEEHLLAGEVATALTNLITFMGFSGISGITIYTLFKPLGGRRIENPEDVPEDLKIANSLSLSTMTLRCKHALRCHAEIVPCQLIVSSRQIV
jgi:hypothetical protein